eukprot:746968-Pyramimonas_sp.AAC.1
MATEWSCWRRRAPCLSHRRQHPPGCLFTRFTLSWRAEPPPPPSPPAHSPPPPPPAPPPPPLAPPPSERRIRRTPGASHHWSERPAERQANDRAGEVKHSDGVRLFRPGRSTN